MFADDLLILSRGTLKYVSLIAKKLANFSKVSRLNNSPTKSSVFMGGINGDVQEEILRVLNMSRGYFPVK